jgi:triacylglycerol lipase
MQRAPYFALLLGVLVAACADIASATPSSEEGELNAAPAALFGPEPKGTNTKFPIVLVHGFDGAPNKRFAWNGVEEALERDGHEVEAAVLPPYASTEVRAEALKKVVEGVLASTGAQKVNLIAHSMGGLDSRHLISALGFGDKVASLSTISTPHRGSAIADASLAFFDKVDASNDSIRALAPVLGIRVEDTDENVDLRGALEALAEKSAAAFNASHEDDPRVYYQSWAGVSTLLGNHHSMEKEACKGLVLAADRRADRVDISFLAMLPFVTHGTDLRPSDGLVTVESAVWANFRGCIPADHLDEVGQPNHAEPDRRTGFDPRRFYRNVAFELASKGF